MKKIVLYFLVGIVCVPLPLGIILSYIRIGAILYLGLSSLSFFGMILIGIAICTLVFKKKAGNIFVVKNEKYRFLRVGIFLVGGAGIAVLSGWMIYNFYLDGFGSKQKIVETKLAEPSFNANQWNFSCYYKTAISGDYYDFLCGDKNAQIENWGPDAVYKLTLLENSRYIIKVEKIK